MPDYSINTGELRVFVPRASEEALIEFIALVSTADACLEGQSVPEDQGKMLKKLAACHMAQLTLNEGRGAVVSESVPAGSRSFAQWRSGPGLESTPFGSLLKGTDTTGCLTHLFDADGTSGPKLFLGTAGT